MPNDKSHMIGRPKFCVIEVSHRCMFRCKMCNYGVSAPEPEVSVGELIGYVSSFKDFVNTPFEINISGGEPLLKEGALELLGFISGLGFNSSMATNAYLINRENARRLADSGVGVVPISLDSLDGRVHDYLRGKDGAHKNAMDALNYFMEYRGRLRGVVIQSIIMEPTLDGLVELAGWADQRDISVSFMAVMRPNMVPVDLRWHEREEFSFLWPKDTAKAHSVIDKLIEMKQSGCRVDTPVGQLRRFKSYFADPLQFVRKASCGLGEDIVHINNKGDIYLCCEMEPIGNVKDADIRYTWFSPKAARVRREIKKCRRNCAEMINCYREE
ncbi:MAG: radical SAM protein [Candidatus Omnitrophica bacterium]|nr:radical SAM protein [Candidatus Omnitrophota bacterium]